MSRKRRRPARKPINEGAVKSLLDASPAMLVPWFLITSFLYYCHDESVISDGLYDDICMALRDKWEEIEHPHKHLIDRGALDAGTGFYLSEDDYPNRVKFAAWTLLHDGFDKED